MSNNECPFCKNKYSKHNVIPMMLDCGDNACNSCIQKLKSIYNKDEFECPSCCKKNAKSLNIECKAAYPNEEELNKNANNNHVSSEGEFEVYIREKNSTSTKIAIKVTKNMTIGQLKGKIKKEKGIDSDNFELAFKKPLTDLRKTLENYGITKPVTITQISKLEGGIY